MIIPLKKKYRDMFTHPKRAGQTDNGTRTKPRRKKSGGPDVLLCGCGGVVKMVSVFKNGKLHQEARCAKCQDKRRKPREF